MKRRGLAIALTVVIVIAAGAAAVVTVRAFVDANPARHQRAWELLHDWHGDWSGVFAARTADADGLRIRDAFGKDRPPLRFETHDAGVARDLLDCVRIDERWSGFGCTGPCCSGEYTVDVLRGSSVAVSFNITDGRALRSGQMWPRDAMLTRESSEAVCAWLVAHGADVESPGKKAARIAAETTARDAAKSSEPSSSK